MSWPIKISFRPNPDKEIITEIKIDPQSSILTLLLKACEIFNVNDTHNYSISYAYIESLPRSNIIFRFKKTILPLLESLKETKLAQGSTVAFVRNVKVQENREVLFNYKIQNNSNPVKYIGRYRSEDNFVTCLQNVPNDTSV